MAVVFIKENSNNSRNQLYINNAYPPETSNILYILKRSTVLNVISLLVLNMEERKMIHFRNLDEKKIDQMKTISPILSSVYQLHFQPLQCSRPMAMQSVQMFEDFL